VVIDKERVRMFDDEVITRRDKIHYHTPNEPTTTIRRKSTH